MKKPLEVPSLYPDHDYTLHGAFASRAARDPDRPFVLFGERVWTWRASGEEVERIASALLGRGVQRGDRVSVMSRHGDGHVLMLFALGRIGAIMVPVNPEFGVEEARYVLHHAEVSGVVASVETLPIARRACAGLASARWFLLRRSATGTPK
jgi:carnitine-CoA ligase